jgi:hypothetical protein
MISRDGRHTDILFEEPTNKNCSAETEFSINPMIHIDNNTNMSIKEGYEAMLLMLKAYWEATESTDLTDILSGGEYWPGTDYPADSAFWEYWLEAIDKLREEGPLVKVVTILNQAEQDAPSNGG